MPDPWTTPGIPGAQRLICPLCDWYYDEPPLDAETATVVPPEVAAGVTAFEEAQAAAVFATLSARYADTESMVRGHFETHELIEWAQAAVTLQRLRVDVQTLVCLDAPTPERILDLLCEGKLTVNDARWVSFARGVVDVVARVMP